MIAITNMERPKECEECLFYEYDSIFEEERWSSAPKCLLDGDSDDCPLIDIVTCKECIHKIQALSTEKGATGCELISGTFYEDFFCKEGERRNE